MSLGRIHLRVEFKKKNNLFNFNEGPKVLNFTFHWFSRVFRVGLGWVNPKAEPRPFTASLKKGSIRLGTHFGGNQTIQMAIVEGFPL